MLPSTSEAVGAEPLGADRQDLLAKQTGGAAHVRHGAGTAAQRASMTGSCSISCSYPDAGRRCRGPGPSLRLLIDRLQHGLLGSSGNQLAGGVGVSLLDVAWHAPLRVGVELVAASQVASQVEED